MSSDSSSLSSALPTDDERLAPIFAKAKTGAKSARPSTDSATGSPAQKKRPASPPHEEVLADNPAIALILLKTLVIWSLNTSDAISATIKESYKQSRHDDDLNQPLSVQPWGRDGEKRRYWLIEGQDDTSFRLYRESNPALKHNTWRSIAGNIDEVRAIADKLGEETSQASRRLSQRIMGAIPRFEATEEKRKRREYRQIRKAQFTRPEPGFSLYEGRTRGKRLKYTYSDEEDSNATSTRRSTRHSGVSTPAGPTVTASGRQIRSRVGGAYGESTLSGQATGGTSHEFGELEDSETSGAPRNGVNRATHSGGRRAVDGLIKKRKHIDGYNSLDEMGDEEDATSTGGEWDGDNDDDDEVDQKLDESDEEEDMSEDDNEEDATPQSLMVTLRYRSPADVKLAVSRLAQTSLPVSNGISHHQVEPEDAQMLRPDPLRASDGVPPASPKGGLTSLAPTILHHGPSVTAPSHNAAVSNSQPLPLFTQPSPG
ncbi:hypothetical protein B0A49_00014 [Cryomyces minteri]|uniref:WHIM1 domain-containing protein n=1 Tax=Cryomyces minteri TaxID=331657 RepID=A0A4U0Y4B4_9PEZI|nr:hypothetical protein B0A49_00014 [Cryomyces minteri]